jgi:hypothetical protein
MAAQDASGGSAPLGAPDLPGVPTSADDEGAFVVSGGGVADPDEEDGTDAPEGAEVPE